MRWSLLYRHICEHSHDMHSVCVVYIWTRSLFILFYIFHSLICLLITSFYLNTFLINCLNMLFSFFVASTIFRWFIIAANQTTRVNDRVQIFENTHFSDSLHDFNSFTFSTSKRVFKRSLNDITTDANNRSAKIRKKTSRSSKTKKQPRAVPHATFYLFTFSLSSHITSKLKRKKPSLLSSQFRFSISSFSSFSTWSISSLFAQSQEKNNDVVKNVLRDLIDEKSVYLNEYSSASESNASKRFVEFHDLKEYVSFEKKLIDELEKKSHQLSAFNKSTRRKRDRSKTKRRHGQNLNSKWMTVKNSEKRFFKHLLSKLRVKKNECSYCHAYQYLEKCDDDSESKNRYWHCCSNDRVHDMIVISKSDFDDFEALKNDEAKNTMRALEIEIEISLHKLMYDTKIFDDVKIRTKTSRDFQKVIICYNNVLFFCNELIVINYKNNDWVTFRFMREIKHMLEFLMTFEDELIKFCQIHQIDVF